MCNVMQQGNYKKGYKCLKGTEIKNTKDWKLYRREETFVMFSN